jgi:serine/threonine-protein kinase
MTASRLMVLLFTDIAGSVDLKSRLGGAEAARVIARHDQIFQSIMGGVTGADILKDTGDGFLASFDSATDAVAVALRFQHAVAREPWPDPPLLVRIGIHLGEVAELERETTGKAKISGLAVDLAARVMSLALPGQILLTRSAFDNARQYLRDHPPMDGAAGPKPPPLTWMAHGEYLFQGSDEPLEVFEVGAAGIAPLAVPKDSEKARRAVAADEEETLGWRPGAGLDIPGRTGWTLERRLGEGGFGEVWLGSNKRTRNQRVFKFCYDAERLRSFKRELTLFKLLREALGDREDIARLYEVRLDEAPFYLESEFTEQGSLTEWARAQGGVEKVTLQTRIDLVAGTAEAVAAAHSVGVLHKDIKPGNILIWLSGDGAPHPRLTDFGIGRLTDRSQLDRRDITVAGFTSTLMGDEPTHTGTPMYTPPETLAGRPYTVHGDVFALGVLLYQMVVGDLERPLAQGWEREVNDPLLREDIAACIEGHEEKRVSARALAERLRSLPERRVALKRSIHRKRIARIGSYAGAAVIVLLVVAAVMLLRERTLRGVAETERDRAEAQLSFVLGLLSQSDESARRLDRRAGLDVTLFETIERGIAIAEATFGDDPEALAKVLRTFGLAYKNGNRVADAAPLLERAYRIRSEILRGNHPHIAESLLDMGDVKWFARDFAAARDFYQQSLDMRRRLFDGESAPVAESTDRLASALMGLNELEQATRLYEIALEMRAALHDRDSASIDPMLIAASHNNLGNCLRMQEKYEEARRHFESALDLVRQIGGDDHIYLARGLHNFAGYLAGIGDTEEALARYLEAMAMKERILGPQSPSLAETKHEYAKLLLAEGRAADAESYAQSALAIRRGVIPPIEGDVTASINLLAQILRALDRDGDAESLLAERDNSR